MWDSWAVHFPQSITAGLCSEPLTAALILWPVTREWPRCFLPSTSAALWGHSTGSLSPFPAIIWRSHSDSTFTLFVSLPCHRKWGITVWISHGLSERGLVYWLWCEFTKLAHRRESESLTQENCIFFCHLVTVDMYSYMQICPWLPAVTKKDKIQYEGASASSNRDLSLFTKTEYEIIFWVEIYIIFKRWVLVSFNLFFFSSRIFTIYFLLKS